MINFGDTIIGYSRKGWHPLLAPRGPLNVNGECVRDLMSARTGGKVHMATDIAH